MVVFFLIGTGTDTQSPQLKLLRLARVAAQLARCVRILLIDRGL